MRGPAPQQEHMPPASASFLGLWNCGSKAMTFALWASSAARITRSTNFEMNFFAIDADSTDGRRNNPTAQCREFYQAPCSDGLPGMGCDEVPGTDAPQASVRCPLA